MNKLKGKISRIESSEHLSMVTIEVGEDIFSAVVLETPQTAVYLKEGNAVTLLFKETEVAIAKNLSGAISLRNRFQAVIKRIETAPILSKIVLTYKNREIVSIISTRSAQRLDLREGDSVEWLVKANEVSLLRGEG